MELTKAEIIKRDKISEQSFIREAQAAYDQAEFLLEEAEKLIACANVAREHWQKLDAEA